MVLSSWQSHCKSSPGSFDECRMAPSGRRPKTKPDELGCESACTGCQKLHPPSPFIITQPKSWYSFYRPTEGRRLSRPSWLVTYRDGLPVHRRSPIRILTGSDVAQLRWSRPTRYHYAKLPTTTKPQTTLLTRMACTCFAVDIIYSMLYSFGNHTLLLIFQLRFISDVCWCGEM